MEILYQSTESIKIAETFGFSWSALIASIGAIVCIILIIIGFKKSSPNIVFAETIFGGILLFISIGLWSTKPIYKEVTTYEVRIEENYPYYELTNKYDIIEQKGKILVIREKGWDEI